MRSISATIAVTAGLLFAAPPLARAQNPTQMLQGLLSGNQNQDQALRDAFDRGYRAGRQDQIRDDRAARDDRGGRPDRNRPPPPRGYSDEDQNNQRNPYGR